MLRANQGFFGAISQSAKTSLGSLSAESFAGVHAQTQAGFLGAPIDGRERRRRKQMLGPAQGDARPTLRTQREEPVERLHSLLPAPGVAVSRELLRAARRLARIGDAERTADLDLLSPDRRGGEQGARDGEGRATQG